MLYLLLILLLKRGKSKLATPCSLFGRMDARFLKTAVLFTVLCASALLLPAQELRYKIVKGGEQIGKLELTRGVTDSTTYIRLYSTSSAWILMQFEVNSWEECQYRNGYMVYYKGRREVNGRVKMNRQINRKGQAYILNEGTAQGPLHSEVITNNIMLLYYEEPVNRKKVFSEALKRWVDIRKTGLNSYQLLLDGGNYNEYFYENNTCTKVRVHTSLFNASFYQIN
jgi:hypothetical protein